MLNPTAMTRLGAMTRDFKVVDDTIRLENGIFTKLTTTGVLSASAFGTGSAAHDTNDRIIYKKATGALMYDADGSGAGAAIKFAQLTAGLVLTNADIVVF
jgi:Ca2+-binding RTX toxin-like protein